MDWFKISNQNRKWYDIVLWWEIRRIPYNLIMYFVGLLSFYICFATIPLLYIIIALSLNFLYTFGWIFELFVISKQGNLKRKIIYQKVAYVSYLAFSGIIVLGFSIYLLVS